MSKIYEIFGTDAHTMTYALMERAQIAAAIPSGADVALKPNLVVSAPPETGATTHDGVLSGAIEYLRDHGAKDISIIEGSWVGARTNQSFHAARYDAVSKKYGVPLYDLKGDRTRTVKTALRPMEICCRALDAAYLINLPVLKGHCQTAMTCSLKNCKGCLPDKEKRRFHAEGLMEPIAALAAALRPDLTIVDSICGDLNFEEGGNPVPTGRMMLGTDMVQLDTYGCRLMGLDPEYVPYTFEGVDGEYYADVDWGVIAGKYDEYFFRQPDVGNDPARILESQAALDFVRQADPDAQGPVEDGKYYEGTINGKDCLRVYYQNPEIHPQNVFSFATSHDVTEFFYTTLGVPQGFEYIDPSNQVWIFKQLFNALGLAGILLFLFPSFKILLIFGDLRQRIKKIHFPLIFPYLIYYKNGNY